MYGGRGSKGPFGACHRALGELGGLNYQQDSMGYLPRFAHGGEPPALLPAGKTSTDKGSTQANLTVYTHAPKTHTNTKQQGGISIHVFYCEYVFRLLYVREWFVGHFVCLSV